MMDLQPFDPADYLKSEVGFRAYLEDAALDGPEAVEDAKIVVARARARLAANAASSEAPPERRSA